MRVAIRPWVLWMALSLFTVFVGAAVYSVASRVSKTVDYERLEKLTKENRALVKKYTFLEKQIDSLDYILKVLAQTDIQLRVHANMDVLPEDVRKLGVGGAQKEDEVLQQLKELRSSEYRNVGKISDAVQELLRKADFQKESYREILDTLQKDAHLRDYTPSIRPCNAWQICGFGYRIDPFTRRPRMHNGIDLANQHGTPIVATADGTVSYVGSRSGYGLCVVIDHGYGVETFYAHLSGTTVRIGQTARRGDMIGSMGRTGRTTGTHLHYEVRVAGRAVNPLEYIIDSDYVTD